MTAGGPRRKIISFRSIHSVSEHCRAFQSSEGLPTVYYLQLHSTYCILFTTTTTAGALAPETRNQGQRTMADLPRWIPSNLVDSGAMLAAFLAYTARCSPEEKLAAAQLYGIEHASPPPLTSLGSRSSQHHLQLLSP